MRSFHIRSLLAVLVSALALQCRAEERSIEVTNPSFETVGAGNVPNGWQGDRAVYSTDSLVAHSGKASLKFSNSDPKRYRLCTQKFALQPGWKVRVSAWVKTKDLVGPKSGATICLEWTDKQGKWLGGVYPHGVTGTRDWTRIELVTRLPENMGNCTLACYARRGMTGEAWFDDVEVARVTDPPMSSTLLSPNYRGRIPAGTKANVLVRARLNTGDLGIAADQLTFEATIQRTVGAEKVADAKSNVVASAQPTDIALSVPGLTPGDYELVLKLKTRDGKELQTDRHPLAVVAPDAAFKCAIDAQRRLLVDGKPFFPLGMYWSGINEKDLKLYADSKFNCIMPYASPTQAQLDLAQQHRIKVIYSVKDWYFGLKSCPSFIKSAEGEEAQVRQRVRQFKEHPALLAWYLNDELGQEYLPRLEAHQRWVSQEDPQHPTWAVLYQVDQVRSYLKTFDVIGTDPYPIGRKPASTAAHWSATTFDQAERARPMWQVPQVFNWGNYAKNEADKAKGRTPTPDEMRSMAWQCICEGGTGLVFYSWFDIKRNADVPFEKQWEHLKWIAAEIDRFSPVLLSIETVEGVAAEGDQPKWLHWIARSSGGKVYVFATNDGDGEGPVSFKVPAMFKRARELTGGHDLLIVDGMLQDALPKLAVKVYEME